VTEVDEGVRLAAGAETALREIIESVRHNTGMIKDLSTGADQVNEGTQHLSAASQQITSTVQQVSGAAQELAGVAAELQRVVEGFKLDSGSERG